MGDLECGFEEMQGVRLGYLLIQGKQMFALSQVFTELLKNIPRTTVHKRMDHLNVKKHHCDLEELRKLKAINSIAFHAAKCTLISREDVEALYFSCKTERVLKSNKRKAKAACAPGGQDASRGLLHADAELWKEKVWFSLHGVPETLALHSKAAKRRELSPRLTDAKLPQFYHKSHGRDYHAAARSAHKHFKNYETCKIAGQRGAPGRRHAFFRSAASRQPLVLQSAMAAQSKLSRSAGDLLHKRKRRREGGGGGRDGARLSWSRSRHAHHHPPPVLLVQPKAAADAHAAFGALRLSPDFYLDPRPHHHHHHQHHHHHHHHHHHEPGFPEGYSSDTESSTYSDRACPDSDFGSGFSTTSNSGSSEEEEEEEEEEEGEEEEEEEGEDEDDTQSESTEVSSDEEESSSQSDSSSVSSRVSVQSIRFRRARVGCLAKTLNPSKAPLVLQPTFHYSNQQQQQQQHRAPGHAVTPQAAGARQERRHKCEFRKDSLHFTSTIALESFFAESKRDAASEADANRGDLAPGSNRTKASHLPLGTPGNPGKSPPGLSAQCEQDKDAQPPRDADKREARAAGLKLPAPPKKIKVEAEEPCVTAATRADGRTGGTPPFNLHSVKVKVEESCDEYEYQSQLSLVKCKGDKTERSISQYPGGGGGGGGGRQAEFPSERSPDAALRSPCGPREGGGAQDGPCVEELEIRTRTCRAPVPGKKLRLPRTQTKQTVPRLGKAASSSSSSSSSSPPSSSSSSSSSSSTPDGCEEGSTEDLPSRRKRSAASAAAAAAAARTPFSLMANFPFPPSLVVGSDGDLCPAYSLNSLRGPGPPLPSHPVWSWQPGGQILPPPHAPRTRKH